MKIAWEVKTKINCDTQNEPEFNDFYCNAKSLDQGTTYNYEILVLVQVHLVYYYFIKHMTNDHLDLSKTWPFLKHSF